MNPEDEIPVGVPAPRVDSFEVIEPAGPSVTEEEKPWPVGTAQVRMDAFEVVERPGPASQKEVGIRISIPDDAIPDEVAAVVQKLRVVAEEIRATTGGRFPIHVDTPIQTP
jgi:hypothetical protein